jgi:hypothetical protein
LILLIGLVPTIIFAWALELTPDGIRLEKDVDRSNPNSTKTGRTLNFVIIGLLKAQLDAANDLSVKRYDVGVIALGCYVK